MLEVGVKAPDFDSGMRRFESFHPCQGAAAELALIRVPAALLFFSCWGGEEGLLPRCRSLTPPPGHAVSTAKHLENTSWFRTV